MYRPIKLYLPTNYLNSACKWIIRFTLDIILSALFHVIYREHMIKHCEHDVPDALYFLWLYDYPFSDHCKWLYFDGRASRCHTLQKRPLHNVVMKSFCLFQGATTEHSGPLTSLNSQECFHQNNHMRFIIGWISNKTQFMWIYLMVKQNISTHNKWAIAIKIHLVEMSDLFSSLFNVNVHVLPPLGKILSDCALSSSLSG